ncbi:MAG TPA: 30S ribosomal protein S17 [Dehalococcoidia bacterium]|jgi:small subunit ribosomal protein S17|nr:30S ribosomal protein S17 [Dehalococcoidia bacterium]
MRKVRVGAVVRTNQDKTAIVEMVWKQRHRLYRKQMRRVARFYVHDPENQCRLGDTVRIEETRRISKNKHWRLMEILERKQIAEVRPIDLETDVAPEMTQPRILAAEARAEATAAEASEEPEAEVVEEEAVEEPEAAEETPEEDAPEEDSVEEEAADEEAEEEPEPSEEPEEKPEAAEEEPAVDEPQEDEAEDDEPQENDTEADESSDSEEPDEQEKEE